MKKLEILEHYFGYAHFRPLQEEVIDAILAGRDLLMILPTGGGKSLCYQLPALMMEGVTVVISPLLALMHDQVTALRANGIAAAMLSSMQTEEESREIERQLLDGAIKLLYVAPERLTNSYFLNLLKRVPLRLFVIDEAHCVSEWGHEFRDDYRRLSLLKAHFGKVPVAAFTATATRAVEEDIISQLSLQNPLCVRGSLYRNNLHIRAEHRIRDGRAQLIQFLQSHKGESGIIYTLSRKATESIATYLERRGIAARPYHAGLPTEEKRQTYAAFVSDKIEVVVATIAFGMGIDKSNIRFVVHMTLPKTPESFYQEIGRAGRDGLPSETLLLFSSADLVQQRHFIDALPPTPYREHAYNRLERMMQFAGGERCRHQSIAAYFDEVLPSCEDHCDNCLLPQSSKSDISTASRKLLSAIYRTNQQYGLHYIVDILRGSREQRIVDNGHEQLSVFGIGREYSKAQWLSIGDRLLEIGAVQMAAFRIYHLTALGIEILKGERGVEIQQKRLEEPHTPSRQSPSLSSFDDTVFQKLREFRAEIARENSLPPYMVFSDKTLKEMSAVLPTSREEMLALHGVGEVKFSRYGNHFLTFFKENKFDF